MGLRPTTDAELATDFGGHDLDGYSLSDEDSAGEEPGSRAAWVLPTVAIIASSLWLGAMVWLARGAFPLPPIALVQFVAALCVVPTLIAVLCILALRTSRAEARRFGATARAMRSEAGALEETVLALGQRIEANRRLLAEQAQSLAAIGEATSSRLDASATALMAEAKVLDTIGASLDRTADQVTQRLATVFDALPRAQAETTAMGSSLTTLGLTASEHAAELGATLAALSERGRAAEELASGAAAKLGAHIVRMESSSDAAAARLDSVAAGMTDAIDTVLDRAATAIDESRKGIAAQGEAMLAMLAASQAALDRSGRDGADALHQRLVDVEGAVERITRLIAEQQRRSETLFETMTSGVATVAHQFERLHDDGNVRARSLTASIEALTVSSDAMNESMQIGTATAEALVGTAESLITALDASAREIDETLPEALLRLDTHIAESRRLVGTAQPDLLALVTAAEGAHGAVEAIAALVTTERAKIADITATLADGLATGRDKAETIHTVVGEAIAKTRLFADEATPGLIEALTRIRQTADRAAGSARDVLGRVVPEAAAAIEAESADAVRRAFARALPQPLSELGHTSEQAVTAATRASERLAVQLMTISESTAMLEARIDAELAEREAANQDSFARRVSLLIEALNSASIDISKTLAHEVSDSAWAAYLKGDRGVFTRRAVRLLDNGQAREIARMYDDDAIFRDHVNRYIHDFEAMLRQILPLRDGSPLGVTLLSSDMGKLYVALAQAIERLR